MNIYKRQNKYFVDAISHVLTAALNGEIKDRDALERLSHDLHTTWDMGHNDGGASKHCQITLELMHAVDKAMCDLARLSGVEPPPALIKHPEIPDSDYDAGDEVDDLPF